MDSYKSIQAVVDTLTAELERAPHESEGAVRLLTLLTSVFQQWSEGETSVSLASRLVEIDKENIGDLPEVIEIVSRESGRFILFCDDLYFEEGDIGYKRLKTVLDGSIAGPSCNALIYATSNRRHLIAERASDNLARTRGEDGALHPGEEIEEKVSLSERFGLWISFYSFSPDEYLNAVNQWLATYGVPEEVFEDARVHAIRWATQRGSRSGRIAAQFARDYAGRIVI